MSTRATRSGQTAATRPPLKGESVTGGDQSSELSEVSDPELDADASTATVMQTTVPPSSSAAFVDDDTDFAAFLAAMDGNGALPDAPPVTTQIRTRNTSDGSHNDDENEDADGEASTTKASKKKSTRGAAKRMSSRQVGASSKPAVVKATTALTNKKNELLALVRQEAAAKNRPQRAELDHLIARGVNEEDEDAEMPFASQTSNAPAVDALGNVMLSPSRRGKATKRQIGQSLKLVHAQHYLGDGVKEDEFEALNALCTGVGDDTGDEATYEQEDEQERLAAAETARLLYQRIFWASVPAFDVPTLWEAGTDRPVALLVHRALQVGLASPPAFRPDVISPAMPLEYIDALVCLAWIVSLLVNPGTPSELASGLQIVAEVLLGIVARNHPRMVDEPKWPLSADRVFDALRSLGAKPDIVGFATSAADEMDVEPPSSTAGRERGWTPLDNLTGPTPTQLTDAMDSMVFEMPSSSPADSSVLARSAAVMRLLDLIQRGAQLGLISTARTRALVPVFGLLSIDPKSAPLCSGVDAAVDAMLSSVARAESSALLSVAHALVTRLAELPRRLQVSVVMSLPGATVSLRAFRRWVAWGLLVGVSKLVPITELESLPPRRPLYYALGWKPAKESFEMPSTKSPFDPRESLDPTVLLQSLNLLQYALSDMRPHIAVRPGMSDDDVRSRVAIVVEIGMIVQGVKVLNKFIRNGDVKAGDPDRALAKLMLDKLASNIEHQVNFDRGARDKRAKTLAAVPTV